MSNMYDEATHLRADLHEHHGRAARQAREMRGLLLVAQSALNSGRHEVAAQRVAAVLRMLEKQLGA